MKNVLKASFVIVSAMVLGMALLAGLNADAQKKPSPEEFQAQAMGKGTQMGQSFDVTLIINEYSPLSDRQILVDAFKKAGNQGLVNALSKMGAKGRLMITGTLGYDVDYIRSFSTPNGRKIRLVTGRPIRLGELWTDSRSTDYELSALELDLSNQKGKSTGTLLTACQFQIGKDGELELTNLRNLWSLVNIMDRSEK
jgi:hypothetical protein